MEPKELKEITSIRVYESTTELLKALGKKGETYDTIIVWLLENCKKKR